MNSNDGSEATLITLISKEGDSKGTLMQLFRKMLGESKVLYANFRRYALESIEVVLNRSAIRSLSR
jgi:hypothetical protein